MVNLFGLINSRREKYTDKTIHNQDRNKDREISLGGDMKDYNIIA